MEWRTKKVKKRKKEREWRKTEECKNSVEVARKHREMLKCVCCCNVRQTAFSIWRCFRPISVPFSGREKKQKKEKKNGAERLSQKNIVACVRKKEEKEKRAKKYIV